MKRIAIIFGFFLVLGQNSGFCATQKEVKLTTYYPAPYGEYKEVKTEKTTVKGASGASASDAAFQAGGNTGTGLVVTNGNNVGIGTETPEVILHVKSGGIAETPVPAIKIEDGNQSSGKVLTSDASGIGTWQNSGGSLSCVTVTTEIATSPESSVSQCPSGYSLTGCHLGGAGWCYATPDSTNNTCNCTYNNSHGGVATCSAICCKIG